MSEIPILHFLIISCALFCIGLFAVLTRKNAIMVLIGIEFMLNAAILNLVVFGAFDKVNNAGQMFALFAIVLAAAGVAVALAIIINVHRHYQTIDPNKITSMKN